MNSLYLENSTMGSLFRFFSRYFSKATRPTQFLLTWLVIAQLALQSFPSLRFLHRNFLSQVTHRCLNSYYRALRNETVTSRSLRLQTAELACSLIPAALQNEPVFLSVDDTTVPKFGKKFDAVSPAACPCLPYGQALCEWPLLRQFDAECPCFEPA